MLVKRLKSKQSKAVAIARPAPKTVRKAKVWKPEFTPEEVASFENQLARHQQSERAWQSLTAPPDGEDRWSELEEHLLYKSETRGTAERRWKYFSK